MSSRAFHRVLVSQFLLLLDLPGQTLNMTNDLTIEFTGVALACLLDDQGVDVLGELLALQGDAGRICGGRGNPYTGDSRLDCVLVQPPMPARTY